MQDIFTIAFPLAESALHDIFSCFFFLKKKKSNYVFNRGEALFLLGVYGGFSSKLQYEVRKIGKVYKRGNLDAAKHRHTILQRSQIYGFLLFLLSFHFQHLK